MNIVRSSKFRHVFGTGYKPDACFNGLKTEGTGDTNCAVSSRFFAMVKASKIFVVPLEKSGRQEENSLPFIDCKSKVLDIAWSPFNDYVLASAQETGDIDVWVIPEGGLKEPVSEPFWQFHNAHVKKVTFLLWHPVAENILLSGGHDSFLAIWDCENQSEAREIEIQEFPTSADWNHDGSLIAVTAKSGRDMTLSVIDARTGETLQKNTGCHVGTKPAKCCFLDNGNIITVGSDRQANREIKLWKSDDISSVLCEVDAGNSSAVLNIYFDPDLNLLYTAGKGESNISYYEVTEDNIFFLSAYTSPVSQKGGNFLPKRAVNCKQNEIARYYKLQASKCEPISFTVPRKSDRFQTDLFGSTCCGRPSLTAADWLGGKNAEPLKMEFQEIAAAEPEKPKELKKGKPMPNKPLTAPCHAGGKTESQSIHSSSNNGIPEGIDFAELLEDMKKVKATVRKLNKRVTKLEEQLEQVAVEEEEEEEEEE